MSGAQGKSKRPKDSETGNIKRASEHVNSEHNGIEGSAVNQQTASSIGSSTIEAPSTSGVFQDCPLSSNYTPGSLAEVVLEFKINFSDKKGKDELKEVLKEVLKAEIALRNTSGGIIKINSPEDVEIKSRDEWLRSLYEERKKSLGSESGEKDSLDDILDIETKERTTYIFVRKSSVIITNDSYLHLRSEERNYKVQLYSRICNVLKREERPCICKTKERFIKSFRLGETLSYETSTKEHKELDVKFDKLTKALKYNISSFANTQGGTVYFGIRDNDACIIGQKIKDEDMKTDIRCHITECMEEKCWISKSGKTVDPIENDHYHIKFFPVEGADDTYVIAVHICLFPGAAVFVKNPECSVLNHQNLVVNMELNEWFALYKGSFIGNESDEKKLKKRNHGRTVYYSVKDTIPDLVNDLKKDSFWNLKKFPSNAVHSIDNELLSRFMVSVKRMLKQSKWQGIAYIERCWKLNLGLPDNKPDGVICDVLLCSPHFPLILATLTNSRDTSESTEYNIELARTLKKKLVEEGGCLEKMYIKPVTISSLDEFDVFTCIKAYPIAYNTYTDQKYTNILQALLLLLARANSMTSHKLGKQFFKLLTMEQYEILFNNFQSPKLMIKGPPGCGKTVLAIERIHRLRLAGCSYKEVLFVCSNIPLKSKIENMPTMQHDNEPLCLVKNNFEIYKYVESRRRSGLELEHLKHIVADEVQNYKESPENNPSNWWETFLSECKSCQSIWVFSDLSQQIHTESSVHAQLDDFPSLRLNRVIRMTGEIYRFLFGKLKDSSKEVQLAHDLDGEKVQILIPKRPSQTNCEQSQSLYTDILILVLHRLIVRQGYNKNQIAVLFTDQNQRNDYTQTFTLKTESCEVRSGEKVKGRGVVFDTIRRYSGDEKDIIIAFLPEFYTSGSQDNDALIVTAASRAIMKLVFILKSKYVAKCFGLEDFDIIEVPKRIRDSVTDFSAA